MEAWGAFRLVQTAAILLLIGLVAAIWSGWQRIRAASQLPFFAFRRQHTASGWRLIVFGIVLGVASLATHLIARAAVPVESVPTAVPSPSPTLAPTLTLTPEPLPTATPTPEGTPILPSEIRALFSEFVTPHPKAVFGRIQVHESVTYPPGVSDQVFESPRGTLYGIFSYDRVVPGVRWTAIWYFECQVMCVDTKPWDGEIGGWGYTDCSPEEWLPGEYAIHIFLGEEWKTSTAFLVLDAVATRTPTAMPSPTTTP